MNKETTIRQHVATGSSWLAILERDGYCVVAGLAVFTLTICFFGALFWGGTEAFSWLREMLRGILEPDDAYSP